MATLDCYLVFFEDGLLSCVVRTEQMPLQKLYVHIYILLDNSVDHCLYHGSIKGETFKVTCQCFCQFEAM